MCISLVFHSAWKFMIRLRGNFISVTQAMLLWRWFGPMVNHWKQTHTSVFRHSTQNLIAKNNSEQFQLNHSFCCCMRQVIKLNAINNKDCTCAAYCFRWVLPQRSPPPRCRGHWRWWGHGGPRGSCCQRSLTSDTTAIYPTETAFTMYENQQTHRNCC